MPLETIKAFRDHGRLAPTLEQNVEEARETLRRLTAIGIDLAQVTQELQDEGVKSFAKSFDDLTGALAKKQEELSVLR